MALMSEISEFGLPKGAQQFYPYADNGGSAVAVAGEDYALIASETRLTSGYMIYTRNQGKLFKLSDKTVLGSSGCWCDVLTFTRLVGTRMQLYAYEHHKTMSTTAVAQLVSNLLYYKRFFPYYISNVVAGLDDEGRGVVYHFDPLGSTQPSKIVSGGSAGSLIQPILDNQLEKRNIANAKQDFSMDEALNIVKDVFISAAERDIYTGDSVTIYIITKDGVREEVIPLRKD